MMDALRVQIVAEARSWIGTPWVHQHRAKGEGVDCAGLLTSVAHKLGLSDFDVIDYGRLPDGLEMLNICDAHMTRIPVTALQPGDAACMRIARLPQHIGIVGDYVHGGLSLIHADSGIGRVVEHQLTGKWLDRIVASYVMEAPWPR